MKNIQYIPQYRVVEGIYKWAFAAIEIIIKYKIEDGQNALKRQGYRQKMPSLQTQTRILGLDLN